VDNDDDDETAMVGSGVTEMRWAPERGRPASQSRARAVLDTVTVLVFCRGFNCSKSLIIRSVLIINKNSALCVIKDEVESAEIGGQA